jgi:hypothetical protein
MGRSTNTGRRPRFAGRRFRHGMNTVILGWEFRNPWRSVQPRPVARASTPVTHQASDGSPFGWGLLRFNGGEDADE